MNNKSPHEPLAEIMSAAEVWEDAQTIAEVLRSNLLKREPVIKLQIPLSIYLSALDSFSYDELIVLHRRVEAKLAA